MLTLDISLITLDIFLRKLGKIVRKFGALDGYIILLAVPSDHRNRMTEERPRKFRLNAKNLFLTWPRNNVDSGTILNRIMEMFGPDNVSYVCVAEEEHEDGTPHLHAVVCLKKPCDVRNVATLDAVGGKHGNYQSARNVKDVYTYVRKGSKFVEHGVPPQICIGKKSDAIAQSIKRGETLDSVEEMDPGYFMSNLTKIQQYHQWTQVKKLRLAPSLPPYVIRQWKTTFEIGMERVFKQKQYYLYGPPNTGKTSFILDLMQQGYRGFQIPLNNDFTMYNDESYDFCYLDEFKGQLPMTFLNEFLQGSPMCLNCKFGMRQKKKNLPTFILSNFDLYSAYKNSEKTAVDTLACRLEIVYT